MRRLPKESLVISLILACFLIGFGRQDEGEARKKYLAAKKKCLEQEWGEAIELFQEFLEHYPTSKYRDDARFWVGYSMENEGARDLDAFFAYGQLIKDNPNSSWVDDAIVHQIAIAERFVRRGEGQYRTFLADHLQAPEPSVRRQAALALGRLGDKRALPVLRELQQDEDLGATAAALIASLQMSGQQPQVAGDRQSAEQLEFGRVVDLDRPNEKAKDYLLFKSKRYQQYRSMLRKDENWTEQELLDFGLWQILPTDRFAEYHVLDGFDRREWFRKFWKKQDPTPTTDYNEKYEEFKRRALFARANFSELWPHDRFKNNRDQHLVAEWEHAPWDGRGELYIKYGEPDFRTFAGLYTEEWNYFGLGVDFVVKQYMTNIYGEAITAGPVSRSVHRNQVQSYVDANFIYQPEFIFRFEFAAGTIKKAKFEVIAREDGELGTGVHYTIPAKEFDMVKAESGYKINYLERYVVFDEDMEEVEREEQAYVLEADTEKLLKRKELDHRIHFALAPGEYYVALRIQDLNSGKVVIYFEQFSVDQESVHTLRK